MIAKGSEPWLFTAASVTALFAILSWATDSLTFLNHMAHMGMALTFAMVIFFRDPERKVEVSDDYMISPADGTIIDIRGRKICIFMFLQNVHVNRAPISGKIREIVYKKKVVIFLLFVRTRKGMKEMSLLSTASTGM
nr:phosphatidylserine decarboxylase [Methanosarcina horonobensis]